MNEIPNRYEVWVYYDPIFGHADWFHECDCRTEDEVVEALKDIAMEFHDTMKILDKYVEVKAFRNQHLIKKYRKAPSKIIESVDGEWAWNFDSCMKMCENCIMNDEIDEEKVDDEGRSLRLCRKGQPWFGKIDCRHYMEDDPYFNPWSKESNRDYIPLIREQMKIDCEDVAKRSELPE